MQFIDQVARNFRMILKVCLAINQGFSGRFAGLGYVQSVSWYCFYWSFKIQNVLTLYIYIYCFLKRKVNPQIFIIAHVLRQFIGILFTFPCCLQILFVLSCWKYEGLDLMGYVYPPWAVAVGWCITASSILCIPVYGVYRFIITPGTLKQVIVVEEWNTLTVCIFCV